MLKFSHASRTDQGARHYQEDSEAVWPGDSPLLPKGAVQADGVDLLAVLADGMGGHAAGDVASRTICREFVRSFLDGGAPTGIRLAASLHTANDAIRATALANPKLGGMGATCVGVAVGQDGVHWISVGDSPLWLYRSGEMERLNEDHSLAPLLDQLVADGEMEAEDAANDPRRHYLRSAVTGDDLDLIDVSGEPVGLVPGDVIVLASDGILTLTDDEILRIVAGYDLEAPGAIADALLRAVIAAGEPHQDNTTLVVVKVE